MCGEFRNPRSAILLAYTKARPTRAIKHSKLGLLIHVLEDAAAKACFSLRWILERGQPKLLLKCSHLGFDSLQNECGRRVLNIA